MGMEIFPTNMLIVTHTQKSADSIISMLNSCFGVPSSDMLTVCYDAASARIRLSEKNYPIVFINSPLSDETGLDLAQYICDNTLSQVIFFVKAEIYDEVASRLERWGVLTLSKPFTKIIFDQTVRLASATCIRLKKYEENLKKAQQKLEEQKTINKAKCLVMENMSLGEAAAHRYIEKQAMNLRLSKLEFSVNIIRMFES